jgi:hypothetical protein
MDLHRRSVKVLQKELKGIGFEGVGVGDVERVLYPHFLSHAIGMGSSSLSSLLFPLPRLSRNRTNRSDRSTRNES